jgi:hypothetical protein
MLNIPVVSELRIRRFLPAVVAVAIGNVLLLGTAHAQVDPVPVTIMVMRFVQLQAPDPHKGDGEYFAGLCWPDNAGNPAACVPRPLSYFVNYVTTSVAPDNTPDIAPFWTITRTFDRSQREEIQFTLLVWDRDPQAIGGGGDDVMDINPLNDAVTLTFAVNLRTGAWREVSNAITAGVGIAEGDGDEEFEWAGPGGQKGKILFDISLSDDGDGDDDGILDGAELTGLRDMDGNLLANLANMDFGVADPCRKTVAVEIDFMADQNTGHTHQPLAAAPPLPAAIAEVVDRFDAAPVAPRPNCPYDASGRRGVNLIVDIDDAIAEQTNFAASEGDVCNQLRATRDLFLDKDLRTYFHYSLWVHNLAPGVTRGGVQCPGTPDHIVSLGSWTNGLGTAREQAATFMHELGHSLGLGHGGSDTINFKPNYLSVMNYLFAATGIFNNVTRQSRVDYSQRALATLSETALSETAGINDAHDLTNWRDPTDLLRSRVGNQPVDWNWSDGFAPFDPGPVSVDINGDSTCVRFGPDGASDTTLGGDDIIVGTRAIRAGTNGLCESTANSNPNPPGSTGDDVSVIDLSTYASPCVAPGNDGELQTVPNAADTITATLGVRSIAIGKDGRCDTTAAPDPDPATADIQATPVGQTVPTLPLAGFDDWQNLQYATGIGKLWTSTGAPPLDMTYEEAQQMQSFWDDAMEPPEATLDAPRQLTDGITASFTENVSGVTAENFQVRIAGATTPLPSTSSCSSSGGVPVACASNLVRAAVLMPARPLIPGEYYEAVLAPPLAPAITDGPGNPVTPVTLRFRASVFEQESSVAATYRWAPVRDPRARDGSYVRDDLQGATVSLPLDGTAATWFTVIGQSEGIAQVSVDGAPFTMFDQFDPTTQYQVARPISGLPPGRHNVVIEVTGQSSPAARGTFVSVDDVVTPLTEDRPTLTYTWQPNRVFEDVQNVGFVRAHLQEQDVEFTFRGTGVTWLTVQGPYEGTAAVYVDGVLRTTVNNWAAQQRLGARVDVTGLTDAVHTLRIVVANQGRPGYVSVDAWSVH